MEKLLLVVIMMGLVTYLPRMLPIVLLSNLKLPRYLNTFLQFVPYTVLGTLIFPGILSSTGNVNSAIVGGLISVILAFYRLNIMIIVLGSILGVYFFNNLILFF